jgi:hypothetical protein
MRCAMRFVLSLLFGIATISAFAQESATKEYAEREDANAIGFSAGVSVPDAVANPGLEINAGVSIGNIAKSGISLSVDTFNMGLYPEYSLGLDDLTVSKAFQIGEGPFSCECGLKLSGVLGDSVSLESDAFGELSYAHDDIKLASMELDIGYLSENALSFWLSAKAGVGYEFALSESDRIAVWVDGNMNIIPDAFFESVEASLGYAHSFGNRISLEIAIEPTLSFGDTTELSVDPSATIGFAL